MVIATYLKNASARASRPRDERGADALEQVWAFPLTILIGFCMIALFVAGFTGVSLANSVEAAAMKADFSQAVLATDVKSAVADEIAANSTALSRDDIEVTSASVDFHESNSSASVAGKGTSVSTIDASQTTCTLKCDVACKVPSLIKIWGMGDMRITRTVEVEVPVSKRLEVG